MRTWTGLSVSPALSQGLTPSENKSPGDQGSHTENIVVHRAATRKQDGETFEGRRSPTSSLTIRKSLQRVRRATEVLAEA